MATVTVTFPDDKVPRIRTALGQGHISITVDVSALPTPITVTDLQVFLRECLRSLVREYEAAEAWRAHKQTVNQEVW